MQVTDRTYAEAYLIQALAEGPLPVRELTIYAARNGINESTLRVAGRALTRRVAGEGGALWELDREAADVWVQRFREVIGKIELAIAGFEKETLE